MSDERHTDRVVNCDECGEPQKYAGAGIGWYCTSMKPHPKHDAAVLKMVHDQQTVPRRDYDAQSLELQAVREALELAYRHIDMEALRVSHCNDAARIDAALKQSRGAT